MVSTDFVFSGFSVDDVDEAKRFYGETLGFTVAQNEMGILNITLPGGALVIAYPKPDHVPAAYTVLNIEVPSIDEAVGELESAGVSLVRYEGMPQDDKGVMRGKAHDRGPDIGWFLDPAGNIISVMES